MLDWQERLDVTEVTFDVGLRVFEVTGTTTDAFDLDMLKQDPGLFVDHLISTTNTLPLVEAKTGFVSHALRPIGLPALKRLMESPGTDHDALLTRAQEAARITLRTLLDDELADQPINSGSYRGFQGYMTPRGYPIFHVPGDCAQVFVDPEGNVFDSEDWDSGITEWNFHNTDLDAQLVALWAALGVLSAESRVN